MKPNYAFAVIILITGVLFISGCGQQNTQANTPPASQTPSNTQAPAAAEPQKAAPVKCADQVCFQQQFSKCNPSEIKIPFMGDSTYIITVSGVENGNCHYSFKIVDKTGNAAAGMPSMDCKVPVDKISADTFGHFFGQDSAPGKESIKAEQDKIQADYCTQK